MGAFSDAAPALHDRGCNVIPTREKRPVVDEWRHWQQSRQTARELHALIQQHPGADPAIVLGRGLVDLDFDRPDTAEKAIRERGLPLPVTACFASPHGAHLPYRHDAPLRTHLKILPGVDFLGQGAIVVVPPAAGRHWLLGLEHLAPLPTPWVDCVRERSRRDAGSAYPSPPDPDLQGEIAPHLQSSEYSLLCRSSLSAGPEGLEELFRQRDVVRRVCALLGIPAVEIGRSFRCVLPGHEEAHASASLYRDGAGRVVYHDWHRRSRPEFFTLSQVYAAQVSSEVRALGRNEHAMWMIRLLHDAGVIVLPEVTLLRPLLPPDADDFVARVAEGFDLLRRCRALHDGDAPTPYTRGFASAWVGISEGQAGEAIRWLLDAGLLRQARSYGRLPLFEVGEG